ncbi:MAG: NAD-dependent malic enzyme [Gemmatimonas sp.]|nr:NAD-dependent malic enzyme [Gemmatimonas sp.]
MFRKKHSHASGFPTRMELLHDPALNKGSAFTDKERDALGLRGLLPPRVHTIADQVDRVLENFRKQPTDLAKYIFLIGLQSRNEALFFQVILNNLDEMMPIVYTPTVGQACVEYGHIFRKPRGLFITAEDRGRIEDIIWNWPEEDVRIIVVTDGERILGLGDQGANGMGIPVGKLTLYTACAGVHPVHTLPITLDVGTDREELLNDPLYIGMPHKRLRGPAYDEFIEEFVVAVKKVYPKAIIQFEDFANRNAFRLLAKYRERVCSFNDDIQGTASVALAGLFSSLRVTGLPLSQQKILFFGAGEAGIGIGELIVSAMVAEGMDRQAAMGRIWYVDSTGLVCKTRTDLAAHKKPFAHDHPFIGSLAEAVDKLEPTCLIGVSGTPQTFTKPLVEAMARINTRPVIFALSNPTSKAECTAEQCYAWTEGRALFASGSPFDPVVLNGKRHVPGQGNNAYIFPGVGLGAIVCEATQITDEMFSRAAHALAEQVTESDLETGCLYPPLKQIRKVSAHIAVAVAEVAYDEGLALKPRPDDLLQAMKDAMYNPAYVSYLD